MEVAIIGAGNVGSALAGSMIRSGHTVSVAARDAEKVRKVAAATGARAAESGQNAARDAEIVVLAVPFTAVSDLAKGIGGQLGGKIIIDITNRFNSDDPGAVVDGTSNAESIQAQLPRSRVIKAFNTLFAIRQADPDIDGIQLDGFVAGDDAQAKARVIELVESMGLDPIDAGPLSMSRALEGMAWLNIYLNMSNGWPWQTGWKLLGPRGT